MNNETYRECYNICDKVVQLHSGRRIRLNDYPAAIVSCARSLADYTNARMARSGKVDSRSYRQTPVLETALNSLGRIGGKRSKCDNYIGGCAEPHAAREIEKEGSIKSVRDLVFSYAYRPRTKSVIRYCMNCIDIFNVKNP